MDRAGRRADGFCRSGESSTSSWTGELGPDSPTVLRGPGSFSWVGRSVIICDPPSASVLDSDLSALRELRDVLASAEGQRLNGHRRLAAAGRDKAAAVAEKQV